MRELKSVLKDFIPPVFLKAFISKSLNSYSGDYQAWQEAKGASAGYDSDEILEKVKDAFLKVKNGEAIYERDSVLFDKIHYSWPLLAGLMWVAANKSSRLNLIDFGGSLGSSYYQNKAFLAKLGAVRWCVVEQKNFVDCGKQYFADGQLQFYYDIKSCINSGPIDAIVLSSVLPYLERPYELLDEIKSYNIEYIIIDRTPFLLSGDKDRLAVQNVSPTTYKASYPAWFFNNEKFLAHLNEQYQLVAEFNALAGQITLINPFSSAIDKGFILTRKS